MAGDREKIDIVIVGGGIVGLWCAYSLLQKHKNLTVVVAEAERYLGEHTTGRNSEVLHSGLYYPTGTQKHLHCINGNQLWRKYVQDKNLPFLDCGKAIVAKGDQKEKLDELLRRGRENGLEGIRYLDSREISNLEKNVHLENGLLIPSAGVLNVSECLKSLRHDIEVMGGIVLPANRVQLLDFSNDSFELQLNEDRIQCTSLINTAGLFSVNFRRELGLEDYENFYVKGSYLKLKKKLALSQLIYPIPPDHGLGLGVHLTLDTSGDQKFGPNTEEVENINYSLRETLISEMLPAINLTFKHISSDDLILGYAGVRPKVKKNGKLVTDFVFNSYSEHGIKGYFEFLGIESPGLTASPSLAQQLSKLI